MAKKKDTEKLSWDLKYRPKTLDEVIGQDTIINGIKSAVEAKSLKHTLIMAGQRGCGKTTTARIVAGLVGAKGHDVDEIDAASSSGVDRVRSLIDQSNLTPLESKSKVFILDECHMLSKAASNALLKSLEEPSKNVYWILCTTEIGKIIPTILSRAVNYNFQKVGAPTLKVHVKNIAEKEGFNPSDEILDLVVLKSCGIVRDAVKNIENICSSGYLEDINEATKFLAGADEVFINSIVDAVLNRNIFHIIDSASIISVNNYNYASILDGVRDKIRQLFLFKMRSGEATNDDVQSYYKFIENMVRLNELVDLAADVIPVYEAGLIKMCYE